MKERRLYSATEMAADEIRSLIDSGDLRPGERISPDELASKLHISRTPIRDGLQRLKTEGLVDVVPRVGVFVRQISVGEARDVYAIKAALEPLAAGWAAARGSDIDRRDLSRGLTRLRNAAAREDIDGCAEHVDTIHTKLFDMTQSDALRDAYMVIRGRVKILRKLNLAQPGRLKTSSEQHAQIVEAVVARDAVLAEELMRKHMTEAGESVSRVLDAQGRDAGT